jgi:hypothetical protein
MTSDDVKVAGLKLTGVLVVAIAGPALAYVLARSSADAGHVQAARGYEVVAALANDQTERLVKLDVRLAALETRLAPATQPVKSAARTPASAPIKVAAKPVTKIPPPPFAPAVKASSIARVSPVLKGAAKMATTKAPPMVKADLTPKLTSMPAVKAAQPPAPIKRAPLRLEDVP